MREFCSSGRLEDGHKINAISERANRLVSWEQGMAPQLPFTRNPAGVFVTVSFVATNFPKHLERNFVGISQDLKTAEVMALGSALLSSD